MERAVINKDTVKDVVFSYPPQDFAVTEFSYGELTWRNRDRFEEAENV